MRKIKRGRRRARRLIPKRRSRIPWIPVTILSILLIAIGSAALLDSRRDREEETEFVDYARSRQGDPIRMIVSAGRRHQMIFLGDLPSGSTPKRIAADAIEALVHGPGLDAVVLEIGADLQDRIDLYLETEPEDPGLLLAEPRIVHGHWGASDEYLEIFRRVWRLNRALEPGRRIRILAADLPGWPPDPKMSPQEALAQYAERDAYMTERIEAHILAGNPRARLLIFMDGYHGLKSGQAELQTGAGSPVPIIWLGTRLAHLHPGEVYTIIVDGTVRDPTRGPVIRYTASNAYDILRKHLPETTRPFALDIGEDFDFLRTPMRTATMPGLDMRIRPTNYRLRDVADGYIFLGNNR